MGNFLAELCKSLFCWAVKIATQIWFEQNQFPYSYAKYFRLVSKQYGTWKVKKSLAVGSSTYYYIAFTLCSPHSIKFFNTFPSQFCLISVSNVALRDKSDAASHISMVFNETLKHIIWLLFYKLCSRYFEAENFACLTGLKYPFNEVINFLLLLTTF